MDLLQKLSQEDRFILEQYIISFGAKKFIGLDEWLKNWNYSKRKLYKLLGNQLIYKIPFSYEKDNNILRYEIEEQLFHLTFKHIYRDFYKNFIISLYNEGKINKDTKEGFSMIVDIDNFIQDTISKSIKFKKEGSKKMLQIQKGMKPIRALQKIMEYFPDEFQEATKSCYISETDYKKAFEEFRIAHSMILNDKYIKGNLCISIHPMDFLTMSDNNSDWSSCMSWTEEGCYRIGSVEMMNSNNVLCCYLESSTPYEFTSKETGETISWNNKKWRVLFYYTNDIIMSGKPYPYPHEEMTKKLLTTIRKLAEKNLHRTYSFGPELYKDMVHINSLQDMRRNYNWVWEGDNFKHSILWDTRGMYNDMFNDSKTQFWCVRNKVKHKKIYQVSGKASCLCCGDTVIEFDIDEEDDYNDRYSNVGSLICYSCESDNTCLECGKLIFEEDKIRLIDNKHKICSECFNKYVKRCPECGKPIYIKDHADFYFYQNKNASLKNLKIEYNVHNLYIYNFTNDYLLNRIESIYFCNDCANKIKEKFKYIKSDLGYNWNKNKFFIFLKENDMEKYKYCNLKSVPFDTKEEIEKN